MLGAHRLLGGATGLFQPFFQPGYGKAGVLRAVAQAVEELGGEGVVVGQRLNARQKFGAGGRIVQTDDLVGHLVGLAAHAAGTVDAGGNAAQVLDQHIADHRGQRPELADLQHLGLLEALDHRGQALLRHGAVGMGHIKPGDQGGAGQFHTADAHLGQLAIELAREVAADLLDRFFDDVVVVQEPFGRRRDGGAGFDICCGGPIDPQDLLLVLLMPGEEIELHEARQLPGAFATQQDPDLGQLFHRGIGGADRIVMIDLLGLRFASGIGFGVKKHGRGFYIQA